MMDIVDIGTSNTIDASETKSSKSFSFSESNISNFLTADSRFSSVVFTTAQSLYKVGNVALVIDFKSHRFKLHKLMFGHRFSM